MSYPLCKHGFGHEMMECPQCVTDDTISSQRREIEELKAKHSKVESERNNETRKYERLRGAVNGNVPKDLEFLDSLQAENARLQTQVRELKERAGKNWVGDSARACATELWNNNWLDRESIDDAALIIDEHAKRANATLTALLREVEESLTACPICKGYMTFGHANSCRLAAALKGGQ